MSFKLKFDQKANTCTSIVMYPSHSARPLSEHLQSKGFRCRMNFRGEEEGCTIFLEDVQWHDAIRAFEEFIGKKVLTGRVGATPPPAIHVDDIPS